MFSQIEMSVKCGENTLAVTRFIPDGVPVKKRVLSLHGAGTAVRQRSFYLGELIASCGGEFVCFDFSGHGESSGTLAESSLKKRKSEAICVIETIFGSTPDIIMGNSMGGFVTLELLSELTPEAVVLLCPAMYSSKAFDVPFTAEFTSILRETESYRNNEAAEHLRRFRGRVFLAVGAEDTVIPDQVMRIYREAAANAREFKDLVIPNAPHVLHVWASSNKDKSSSFLKELLDFILTPIRN